LQLARSVACTIYIDLKFKLFHIGEQLSEMPKTPEQDTVKSLMSKKVFGLPPSRRTIDALNLMVKKDIGSVPVLLRGKLYGIITERDIVREITSSFDYLNQPLAKTSKKNVVTVTPQTEIWEAFTIMLKNRIRRLPVLTDGGKLVGIVTERDLFKWVVQVAYEPEIPDEIKKLIKTQT
jgi:CBS domain-containing protein